MCIRDRYNVEYTPLLNDPVDFDINNITTSPIDDDKKDIPANLYIKQYANAKTIANIKFIIGPAIDTNACLLYTSIISI